MNTVRKYTQDMDIDFVVRNVQIKILLKNIGKTLEGKIQMAKKKIKKVQKQEVILETKQEDDFDIINDKLHFSYILDQTKPNVDKFERAKIIQNYMKRKVLGFGELAKKLNIGKSTLSGWLKWAEITKDEVVALKAKGMSESDITYMLKSPNQKDKFPLAIVNLKKTLKLCKTINGRRLDNKTIELLTQIRNELNGILYRAEKK